MVTLEHAIVQAVYAAKTDTAAADAFVQQYLPFVRAETVRFTRQAIEQGHEDELSIALLAFYEAILSYEKGRGAFLPYAARAIRNRLIDHFRAERRHRGQVSMQASAGEDGRTLADTLPARDELDASELRLASRQEIAACPWRSWRRAPAWTKRRWNGTGGICLRSCWPLPTGTRSSGATCASLPRGKGGRNDLSCYGNTPRLCGGA